jgi:hypothetical protein
VRCGCDLCLRDWDVDYNTVSIIDSYTTPAVKVLTGNNTTIYGGIFVDLDRDGPMVIDSPTGVYGVIDDYWQRPIVEVGPFGPDKGKGGKFLDLCAQPFGAEFAILRVLTKSFQLEESAVS